MLRVLGYIWATPNTLVGCLLALYYWPRAWCISEGCIEAIPRRTMLGNPGAQTHGWLIYYRSEASRSNKRLRVHERVHVRQGFIGGPFFMLAYAASFAWFYLKNPQAGWYQAYMQIPFERTAYAYDAAYARGEHPGAWGSNPKAG